MTTLKKSVTYLICLPALFFFTRSAKASDHIDGPVTTKHRVADLTDLYAFPTPGKSGFLSVILNTYPLVEAAGHFTDKVTFNIFLRKATQSPGFLGKNSAPNKADAKGRKVAGAVNPTDPAIDQKAFQTSDEVVISCTFRTPVITLDHEVKCQTPTGLSSSAEYEVVTEDSPTNPIRIYSGMRSDPFFFNAGWAQSVSNKGIIPPPKDNNVMANTNILTIVLELDLAKIFKGQSVSMLAVAAEVTTKDSPDGPIRRLDRLGRPEITNVSLVAHAGDVDLRDDYNLDQPFNAPQSKQKKYQDQLAKNIAYYDKLDQQQNWDDKQRLALATMLADDFLVLDMTKDCNTPTFFEIEKSMLLGQTHQTCGGRKPNDDIMDVLFSMYIGGVQGKKYPDGVDKPSKDISSKFPYLTPPETGLAARIWGSIARTGLGL